MTQLSFHRLGSGDYRAIGTDRVYSIRRQRDGGWLLNIWTADQVAGVAVCGTLVESNYDATKTLAVAVAQAYEDSPGVSRLTRAIQRAYR